MSCNNFPLHIEEHISLFFIVNLGKLLKKFGQVNQRSTNG